ncbi:B12-binding domain-containing radical SAM protein [Desulfomarina profundi]|uniref:B12-binding domain-containing radical SAM protein n=1 Tax=Desulfomarina profundi TaxID=2772557 RepID=A0A8D5FHY6_9BACT|nr:radical SAM protein [Desulfomarina profundi]BCL61678.1 B12-binding domain-containing radical SAM protein [Desulfomarina profundi]
MQTVTLVYPKWHKIPEQTEFHLPPHGPVCVAASIPDKYEVRFIDENVDAIDFEADTDVVLLSMMLTCQLPRGREIAALYQEKGVPVIAGGISTMLHAGEVESFVDSIFLGETEDGRLATVLDDLEKGRLRKKYDYFHDFPPIESVGPADRSVLNDERYVYRGVRMVDLVHASRGCRFNCFPCATAYLGGRQFRPRPIEKVVEEISGIDNNRLFLVDNSLAQDKGWVMELFEALIPLKKKWISHPILDEDDVIAKAAEAGCWYVYQAVFDTSDVIRNRVKRLKDHGIGVEAAVLLGTDNQDADYIKRLVDFLLEIDVDMSEFSILTPFPHTPVTATYEREGRILHRDWSRYTTAEVVYKPKNMSPDTLQEMYSYAWRTFYRDMSQSLRMARLFSDLVKKEMADGTYKSMKLSEERKWAGN